MELRDLLPVIAILTLAYHVRRNWLEDARHAKFTAFEHDIVDRLRESLGAISAVHLEIVNVCSALNTVEGGKEDWLERIYEGPINLHLQEIANVLIFFINNKSHYLQNRDILDLIDDHSMQNRFTDIFDITQIEIFESICEIQTALSNDSTISMSGLNQSIFNLQSGVNANISTIRAKILDPRSFYQKYKTQTPNT